ncbi:MAG: hypothetical protein KC646_01385 [Candidatus Cloacimonetes bacterium]|nr:hypothetical protein [Candidatus Cloacimonadota bacterium]
MKLLIFLFLFTTSSNFSEDNFFGDINQYSVANEVVENHNIEKLLYKVDFSKYKAGNATKTLKKLGFIFKMDAKKMNPTFKNSRLYIGDDTGHVAFYVKEYLYGKATRLKITWGVDQFTSNESWEQGKQSNAIGLAVSFGLEKVSSGTWYVPNMPRFIGYFISKTAKIRKTYVGEHFKLGGKLVCISNSAQEVESDIDLVQDFNWQFPDKEYMPVSGFSIQANTKGSKATSAYIKSIAFYGTQD